MIINDTHLNQMTREKGRDGGGQRSGRGMEKGDSEGLAGRLYRLRLWRRMDPREEDDPQSTGWWLWRKEPGRKQVEPGGSDGGRSLGGGRADDSRGPTDGGGAGGGGARGGDGEPMSQGDGRIRRARVEPRALVTEAEIRRPAAEPEQLRTKVELEGGRSPTEPEKRSTEAMADMNRPRRSRRTREPGGAGGPMGDGGDEGARSRGGAAGSKGRGGVWDSEAGGGDKGSSSHDVDGDWQTCGDPTAQMVSWGAARKQRWRSWSGRDDRRRQEREGG